MPEATLMAQRKCPIQPCPKGLLKWRVVHVSDQRRGIMRLPLQVPDLLCSAELHFRFRCYRTPKNKAFSGRTKNMGKWL